MSYLIRFCLLLSLCWGFSSSSPAEVVAKTEKKAPPEVVSDAIKKVLGDTCHQLVEGDKPLIEFWFCAPVPLKEKPESIEKGLDSLNMASLLGVVRIHKDLRDYRDDDLSKGVHTIRYGKIPSDGNHLGTSEYPYFAVLIPAADDTEIDGIKSFKSLTKASAKNTASEHPVIMSLRPVKKKPSEVPSLAESAAEHKGIVVSISGKPAGREEVELVFEVVFEGVGEL
jgi:hypothetical protein